MKKGATLYDRVRQMEYPQLAGGEKGYAVRGIFITDTQSNCSDIQHAVRDKLTPSILHAPSGELGGVRISDALRRKLPQADSALALSRYKLYVPSVVELRAEIKREVRALEGGAA